MKRRILPSITTAGNSRKLWPSLLAEARKLKLKECAVFLTGLDAAERQNFYTALEGVSRRTGLRVPFVHARSDMGTEEYDYLIATFGVEMFNLHPCREMPLQSQLPSRLKRLIYIENTTSLRASDLRGFAGICTDVAHIEDYRRLDKVEEFTRVSQLVRRFPVGASHISAVTKRPYVFKNGSITYAPHRANLFSDLAYLRSYPRHYFGSLVALELENSLAEQLEFKTYIEQSIWRVGRREEFPAFQPIWHMQPSSSLPSFA